MVFLKLDVPTEHETEIKEREARCDGQGILNKKSKCGENGEKREGWRARNVLDRHRATIITVGAGMSEIGAVDGVKRRLPLAGPFLEREPSLVGRALQVGSVVGNYGRTFLGLISFQLISGQRGIQMALRSRYLSSSDEKRPRRVLRNERDVGHEVSGASDLLLQASHRTRRYEMWFSFDAGPSPPLTPLLRRGAWRGRMEKKVDVPASGFMSGGVEVGYRRFIKGL
jgi:hypothetical protein